MPSTSAPPITSTALERLVEELADAHEDTVLLATGPASRAEWHQHLDYLRALQRMTREMLAHLPRTTGGAPV